MIAAKHAWPIDEIVEDLEFIQQNTRVWDGISEADVDMLQELIAGLQADPHLIQM